MTRTIARSRARPRAGRPIELMVVARQMSLTVEVADLMASRLRGWLGRARAPVGRGLLIAPCDSVHTIAMRFPIDIVFLDGEGQILAIHHGVRPWRVRFCLRARSVIELAAGAAAQMGLQVGDRFERRSQA